MQFNSPMVQGKILKRYKRFLADVKLPNGEVVTAHTANTGSMQSCWAPGWKTLMSFNDSPHRKLKYSVEMIHNSESWIGVNTSKTNALAQEALEQGVIEELRGFDQLQREVKIGDGRLDFLLTDKSEKKTYVEVKNVTLKEQDGFCTFPDAASTRGQKHLKILMDLKREGHEAVMLYIVQRQDCHTFAPAYEYDPDYAELLEMAYKNGVKILVYQCSLDTQQIIVERPLPFTFLDEQGQFWGP